ncbi:MAG: thymidine phosphorylase, partial [candidate division Zixibacteria bacterium]|nr:thymidine phosphorylase [candidate division Zixibacteria bacterium]
MTALELIIKKRRGEALTKPEIEFLIDSYTAGRIPDYQLSSFLMASFLNGLDESETFYLTETMLNSGKSVTFDDALRPISDKHSTGGVGDKISLTLSPLMSALGYNIAMLSGRGLGHTGGTLDKLESIPGLNPFWTENQIKSRLKKTGIAISGQTRNIAPADGKIYALRDLTGTVESIPLITASILSKKLALKTDAIIFDIKVGSGAFMKTRKDATNLARSLLSVCRKFKRRAGCLLTDMSEPLGYQVGNYLEIMETAEFLKTGTPDDIREVTYRLGYEIIRFYNPVARKKAVYDKFDQAVSDGSALARMVEFVVAAGGRSDLLENPKAFFSPTARGYIKADKAGYLAEYD